MSAPSMPHLVLTRPAAQAERFAAQYRARAGAGAPVLIAPLQAIRPLVPEIRPDDAATPIFTSENAVQGLTALSPPAGRPAFCVGAQTAAAAEAAGFRPLTGPDDAAGLLALIIATPRRPGQPLLHARGRHVSVDLAKALRAEGCEAASAIVYEQVDLPVPPPLLAALRAPRDLLVPLFSRRGAARFAAAVAEAAPGGGGATLDLLAISAPVMEAAAVIPARRRELAPHPDGLSMLDSLMRMIFR